MILLVASLAGIFAYSLSTLGVIGPLTNAIVNSGLGECGILSLLILMRITVGMFFDGISIFLIFVPLLLPIVQFYHWDPVWFGVILTLKVAPGQFTPPLERCHPDLQTWSCLGAPGSNAAVIPGQGETALTPEFSSRRSTDFCYQMYSCLCSMHLRQRPF